MFPVANRFRQDEFNHDAGSESPPDTGCLETRGEEMTGASDTMDDRLEGTVVDFTAPASGPDRKSDVVGRALGQLAALAADEGRFHETLAKTFGPGYDRAAAEQLRLKILDGDTSWMPDVAFAEDQQLGGALGAYSRENGTVYINSQIVSPKRAAEVLIEEIGHHLDTLLNKRDSAGDEGEIFRRLVAGETLADDLLADLRSENDHGTMQIGDQTVAVENWGLPRWLFPWAASRPAVRDLVQETRDNLIRYFAGFDERIKAAAKGWVDDLVANAKAYGADLMRSMEKVAGGFGKLARGDLSGLQDIAIGMAGANGLDQFHALARLTMDTISAVQTATGLEPIGRPLRQDEIEGLRKVFGDTIDYSKVTIKEGDAGIFAGDRPIAMGNTIYMKNDRSFETLVHEMTHVWQFQNGGNDYMLKAGWAQFSNWVQGNDTSVAYDWTRDIKEKGWAGLNPEQQAHLIEDAAAGVPSYVTRLETWQVRWAEYEAKEAAFNQKYPPAFTRVSSFDLDGGGRLGGADLGGGGGLRRGGFVGGPVFNVDFQQLAERRALDAERANLLAGRPTFVKDGEDYTAQVDDALWRLRQGVGAP